MKDDKWIWYAIGLLLGGGLGVLVPQVWRYLSWVALGAGVLGVGAFVYRRFADDDE